MAQTLALMRSGGDEPSSRERRRAIRDVVGKCIYGVDLNPMAVELCKIALWMETLEPGGRVEPLSFLDAHIVEGNSLLGATRAMLDAPLPEAAFNAIEGDHAPTCARLKREHRAYLKGGQNSLDFAVHDAPFLLGDLHKMIALLEAVPDDVLSQVQHKARMWHELQDSKAYLFSRFYADAWCAAFVWPILPDPLGPLPPLTQERLDRIRRNPHDLPPVMRHEVERLRARYGWLHPHLAFPGVFERGGFDVMLGNPPWERIKLQEKEWFATRRPEIAAAPNAAARTRLIVLLQSEQPELHQAFLDDRRQAEGESHFARASQRFPLCGRGDVNTYALFAELNRALINAHGRVGCIVPSGIATDDTTKLFFQDLNSSRSLVSLLDFENREKIFPAVDSRMKFCLLTMSGAGQSDAARFVFFALRGEHLDGAARRFTLSPADIALLNPNTRTCPIFRSSRDAELTKAIYRRVPVLVNESQGETGNAWGIKFLRMFDMSNDSGLFHSDGAGSASPVTTPVGACRSTPLRMRGACRFTKRRCCINSIIAGRRMRTTARATCCRRKKPMRALWLHRVIGSAKPKSKPVCATSGTNNGCWLIAGLRAAQTNEQLFAPWRRAQDLETARR